MAGLALPHYFSAKEVKRKSEGMLILISRFPLRGQSDKYLASPPDGATIAREIYYRIVHCRRRLLSKFQPNRTRNFVMTACGSCRVRGF